MVAATASDTVDEAQPARGFVAASSGNVAFETPLTDAATQTVALTNVAAGYIFPGVVTRINSTNTNVTVYLGY
jgi:hypothetical protein